jgi:hypothetical protein
MYIASARRVNLLPGNWEKSDGVRHVDELVLDPEALRHELAKAPDSEGLGRVVAAGEKWTPYSRASPITAPRARR